MKSIKIITVLLFALTVFSSCVIEENNYYDNSVSLDELLQSSDLWYVDYNQTTGNSDTRFMSLAFTLSFQNGKIYANNNLVGLGSVGGGYGDQIGFYDTDGDILSVDHDLDGYIDFEVYQINNNKIKFRDLDKNVTYTLIPYTVNNFDYDKVFYDNIEYFLQEYEAWEKTNTSDGIVNPFDNENFLAFIPENISVFKSSQDETGTVLANLIWDFEGDYEVMNVSGTDTLKVLTLHYEGSDIEEFELSVINDGKIKLYHINSGTNYTFNGRENIIYKKGDGTNIETKKPPRRRIKVKRKTIALKKHVAIESNRQ